MRKLKYLGYIIQEDGIHPDPDKTIAIHNYPTPKNTKDVRRLVGLAGWYRRFIPNFSSITAPLTEMTKKGRKFEWNQSAQDSLESIKRILVSAPVLTNPDYSKPFTIQTDASDLGMGGVLIQGTGPDERVIDYTSAKFSATQRNYQTTERECLAVITAIEKFRPYIEGVKFTVVTDHASLLWLKNLKDPTGRLCRWALRLQPYDFEFVHRKGTQMVVADALSRAIEQIDTSMFTSCGDHWYNKIVKSVTESPEKNSQYKFEENLLFKYCSNHKHGYIASWRLVVPKPSRNDVISQCHDPPLSAHGGYHKTIDRVRRDYFWPNMDSDVRNFIRKCETCKSIKPTNVSRHVPMGKFREAKHPWHTVCLDFIGPLPRSKSGFCHILTVTDSFSKFLHAHPVRNATAKAITSFMEDRIFLTFGVPEIIICDNGSQFMSTEFKAFCDKYDVKLWPVARYHPQANPAEAANKSLETSIKAYIKDDSNHRDWDKYLAAITCALNTSVHSSTKFSPYFVNFGQQMITSGKSYKNNPPTDQSDEDRFTKIRELVKKNLVKAYDSSKKRYDLRSRPIHYEIGDIVWKDNTRQSSAEKAVISKFFGKVKCKVKRKVGSCSYELEDFDGKSIGVFHTSKFTK